MPAGDVIDVWQVNARDRDAGRRALQAILGSYVGTDPGSLTFHRGTHGKPALAGHDLHFSFSRSAGQALVAVSRERPVGVDIERVKQGRAVERIARRLFAADEAAALARVGVDRRAHAFHRCWTGKEAYAKGIGAGLSVGFATFSVAALIDGDSHCRVGAWEVRRIPATGRHAAALAAPGSGWRTRIRSWEDGVD
jgi:4'-phosphopantetheinyl transferase